MTRLSKFMAQICLSPALLGISCVYKAIPFCKIETKELKSIYISKNTPWLISLCCRLTNQKAWYKQTCLAYKNICFDSCVRRRQTTSWLYLSTNDTAKVQSLKKDKRTTAWMSQGGRGITRRNVIVKIAGKITITTGEISKTTKPKVAGPKWTSPSQEWVLNHHLLPDGLVSFYLEGCTRKREWIAVHSVRMICTTTPRFMITSQ